MPGTPEPTAAPPAGSTPTSSDRSSANPLKIPAAFEPPPTQATTTSGTSPSPVDALGAGLVAEDPVELAHHPRIRVRSHHRAEAVVRVLDGGDPVAHRLVDRVLEGAAARAGRAHLGAEEPHPEHVELLAGHVDLAHVHGALLAEQRGSRRGRDAVLTCAGLGHQAASCPSAVASSAWPSTLLILWLPVWFRSSRLSSTLTPPELLAEPVALGERRGSTGVVAEQVVELGAERRVRPGGAERPIELLARGDERLGHEHAAEVAEPTVGCRLAHGRRRCTASRHAGQSRPCEPPAPNRFAGEPAKSVHARSRRRRLRPEVSVQRMA